MDRWTERTARLVGDDNVEKLRQAVVAVVGTGGVGSFAAEFLARAGIGRMVLVDGDVVNETNRNRQLPALVSTDGQPKVDVMAQRLRDINPDIRLTVFHCFLTENEVEDFVMAKGDFVLTESDPEAVGYDFVVDAIDSMGPKTALIYQCLQHGVPIVSAMGAAGKINPEGVRQCDISKTYQCPLARNLRHRLGQMGVRSGLPVVFSPETPPSFPHSEPAVSASGKNIPGTISYMPAVFGCHLAAYVIQKIVLKS